MNERILFLKAEIESGLLSIEEVYRELDTSLTQPDGPSKNIIIGYYLHVLYGLFENIFGRIAEQFGNHVKDKSKWDAELLHRMTLQVLPLRPAIITAESYRHLNELRGFRHLFRNAYLLHFDSQRLHIVLEHAQQLRLRYPQEFTVFLTFLDTLIEK